MDEETTRKADLVFIASDNLLAAKQRLNANTYVSPHGVDLDHFARAQHEDTPLPSDACEFPGPVIGFFGLIEKWIDLELIDYLAQQRPQWTFAMIGRVAVPQEQVPCRPNIRFLGVRPYELLPDYGKQFDVAIIPYRLNNQTVSANPIKLREYLAMGKPIVSISTPEIDKYSDVVRIARTREDFLAQLDSAVADRGSPGEIQRRVARVAPESWDARLRQVMEVVQGQMGRVVPA